MQEDKKKPAPKYKERDFHVVIYNQITISGRQQLMLDQLRSR